LRWGHRAWSKERREVGRDGEIQQAAGRGQPFDKLRTGGQKAEIRRQRSEVRAKADL